MDDESGGRTVKPPGRLKKPTSEPGDDGTAASAASAELATPIKPGKPCWEPPPDDERIPLATIDQLQDLLLVKIREPELKGPDGDSHTVRQRPRWERLPGNNVTPERLQQYLLQLEKCGTHREAARRSGLAYEPVRRIRNSVPEFEEMVKEAIERFKETLENAAYDRAVLGWDEPVFGGKDKDQVVGYIRRYDSRLLELMLKRHFPEYREKFEGELTVKGGVLVVPAQTLSSEEWQRQHAGEIAGGDLASNPAGQLQQASIVSEQQPVEARPGSAESVQVRRA